MVESGNLGYGGGKDERDRISVAHHLPVGNSQKFSMTYYENYKGTWVKREVNTTQKPLYMAVMAALAEDMSLNVGNKYSNLIL